MNNKILAYSILLLFAVLVFIRPDAAIAGFEETAQILTEKSYAKKINAVKELTGTGDTRTVSLLEAMLASRLYYTKKDKRLVFADKSGRVYVLKDALTGDATGEAKKTRIKKVGVNNKLRRVIKSALGGLTLLSPDLATRKKATEAVLKSRGPDLLPLLEQAMAREEDQDLHLRMGVAQAAITAVHGLRDNIRITAIEKLSGEAEPEIRNLLAEVAASEAPEPVRGAAKAALKEVESSIAQWELFANLFQGISLGSVLLLAAVGLAITFGVMGVINMAHGEIVMLGAYTTFIVQELFRTYAPGAFDYSIIVAVPVAFVVTGLVGIAIERGIIRYLYGRPLETLLATWGLSLILQQLVRTVFGPTNRQIGSPTWMSGYVEIVGGVVLTYNRIVIILFSLAVILLLALIMRRTSLGLEMRAVTQNRAMAGSMGIRTGMVDALTFGLGSGIAGIAGVALSQIDNVSPNLGQAYIIDSFMVVVFGGVGNLWGTLVGAFTLGIANKFLEPYAGAVLAKIVILVTIILFIQKRPRGLFALKGRAVEA